MRLHYPCTVVHENNAEGFAAAGWMTPLWSTHATAMVVASATTSTEVVQGYCRGGRLG